MSALGTFFTYRTARNTGATAYAARDIAEHLHGQDLRRRGWLGPTATAGDRAWANHTLAMQAQARAEMVNEARGARATGYGTAAAVAAGALGLAGMVTIAASSPPAPQPVGVVIVVWALAVLAAVVGFVVAHGLERSRAAVLAWAVERDGRCGWCAAPAPHLLEGVPTHPRVFHAVEIKQRLGG